MSFIGRLKSAYNAFIGRPVGGLRSVAYICDRKACEKCDTPDCHHTEDIRHAKNFVSAPGVEGVVYIEKDDPATEVNSGRFYICNREPCDTCRSDCHCTEVLNDAAVLEVSDDFVPYNDCPTGLFLHADGVFLKTEIKDSETHSNMAVHIGLGLARKFDADVVVYPIKYPFKERERV